MTSLTSNLSNIFDATECCTLSVQKEQAVLLWRTFELLPPFACARPGCPSATALPGFRYVRVVLSQQINSNKSNGVYSIGEEILIDVYLSMPVVSDHRSEQTSCSSRDGAERNRGY